MGETQPDDMPNNVTCLRCGATWSEGAVVCFKCGAPIGYVTVNTQPVSTLNASAPPPPELVAEIEAENVRYAAAEKVKKVSALTPAEQRSRNAERLRLGRNVLIAVVVLALGVWAYRSITAAPPVPALVTYHDPSHHFSLRRPALWQATTMNDGVTLTDGSGTCSLRISMRSAGKGETSTATIASDLAKVQSLTSGTGETIGGAQWDQLIGQRSGVDGVTRQIVIFVTLHSGQVSEITETCPVATFSSTENLVFQPVRASFSFS